MRILIGLIIAMGIAIVVALGLVAYGLVRGVGDEAGGRFGVRDLGLPAGCEIADSSLAEGRIVIRTSGLVESGCQQVLVVDLQTGEVLGRITAAPTAP